jgi:hypothetical protein
MDYARVWNEYGLEILACLSVLIILILGAFNYMTNKNGTYNHAKTLPKKEGDGYPTDMEYMEHTEKDSKLELQAKVILENIFKQPFVKVRPDFLKNDVTGYNLELDLYNPNLKLAVEINGDQHYKFIPFFHRNKDAFTKQRYRDEMKKWKCEQAGLTLIDVPYSVGEKGLKPYLVKRLRLEGFLL